MMAKKQLFKKILAVLIVTGLVLIIFASCDERDENIQTTTTTATTSDSKNAPIQEDEEVAMLPDLPDINWKGYTFRVLTDDWGAWGSSEWAAWNVRDITAEEETGDPINDAVYRRNQVLEEKYNFKIEQLYTSGNIITAVKKAYSAEDKYFDVASVRLRAAAISAQGGCFADLSKVHYLDFDKPWWDHGAIANISISKKLFFACGDFGLVNKDATIVMLFNKKLITDLDLENPYELVRNNQWTISKFYEMARIAATDLNGDGKIDSEADRFGFVPSFVGGGLTYGAGIRYAEINKNGLPVLIFGSERDFNVMSALHDILNADFTMQLVGGKIGVDGLFSCTTILFYSKQT